MQIAIRLYPIFALLTVMILVEYSLILRRKGRRKWYFPIFMAVFIALTILFWWTSQGALLTRDWNRLF